MKGLLLLLLILQASASDDACRLVSPTLNPKLDTEFMLERARTEFSHGFFRVYQKANLDQFGGVEVCGNAYGTGTGCVSVAEGGVWDSVPLVRVTKQTYSSPEFVTSLKARGVDVRLHGHSHSCARVSTRYRSAPTMFAKVILQDISKALRKLGGDETANQFRLAIDAAMSQPSNTQALTALRALVRDAYDKLAADPENRFQSVLDNAEEDMEDMEVAPVGVYASSLGPTLNVAEKSRVCAAYTPELTEVLVVFVPISEVFHRHADGSLGSGRLSVFEDLTAKVEGAYIIAVPRPLRAKALRVVMVPPGEPESLGPLGSYHGVLDRLAGRGRAKGRAKSVWRRFKRRLLREKRGGI